MTTEPEKACRCYYKEGEGWVVEVEHPFPKSVLARMAAWAYNMNHDRWLSMPHGDMRERLGRHLTELRKNGLQQKIIAKPNKEVTMFQTTEGIGKTLIDLGRR